MSDLKEAFEKGWSAENIGSTVAGLAGLLTFVILNVLLYRSVKNRKRIKQKSAGNGTAIEAKIVSRSTSFNSKSEQIYYGEYTYQLNGKTKKYRIDAKIPVPDVILLYPKNKNGTRFFSDYDDIVGAAIAFNAIVSIALCVLVLVITRYLAIV